MTRDPKSCPREGMPGAGNCDECRYCRKGWRWDEDLRRAERADCGLEILKEAATTTGTH